MLFIRKVYFNKNTPCVSLPLDLCRAAGIKRGTHVKVSLDETKRITVSKLVIEEETKKRRETNAK